MKTLKKIMTLLLVASMILSFSVTAFADGEEGGSDGAGSVEVVTVAVASSSGGGSSASSGESGSASSGGSSASSGESGSASSGGNSASSGESGSASSGGSSASSGESSSASSGESSSVSSGESGSASSGESNSVQTAESGEAAVAETKAASNVTKTAADVAENSDAEAASAGEESADEVQGSEEAGAEEANAEDADTDAEVESVSGVTEITDVPHSSNAEQGTAVATPTGATEANKWEGFYDEESDTYKLTFTISEDAEGDQTINLTEALDALTAYSQDAYAEYEGREEAKTGFLEYVAEDNTLSTVDNALQYLKDQGLDTSDAYVVKYAEYMVDSADYLYVKENYPGWLDYIFPNGNPFAPTLKTAQAQATDLKPGDTVNYEISIVSESGHTYTYKSGSFVLSTPEMQESETEINGFDGQELTEDYINDGLNRIAYDSKDSANVANKILEEINNGADEISVEDMLSGPIEVLVYRAQLADAAKQSDKTVARYSSGTGATKLMKQLSATGVLQPAEVYALYSLGASANARQTATKNSVAVNNYLKENYAVEGEEGYTAFLLEYYSGKDGIEYEDIEDLAENSTLVQDLKKTKNSTLGNIQLPQNTDYNNFYKNLISFAFGLDQIEEVNGSDSWNYNGNELTVGDYMYGMTRDSGAWEKANAFFEGLLKEGLNKNDAAKIAFNMAFNVDGELTGNDYQLTTWGWYNAIELDQIDGEVTINKVDSETGETITGSETSFQIWQYKDNEDGGQDKYFYTRTTDSETGAVNQGFVKYDPENKSLSYTVDTTGGKLTIDYAMLEGIIYYIQEAVAPEGYTLDTTVYVLCDSEDQMEEASAALNQDSDAKASAVKYGGAVNSEKALEIRIVNTKSPDPVPPVPTPTPDNPNPQGGDPVADEEIDEDEVPLAGWFRNMNEGDCMN